MPKKINQPKPRNIFPSAPINAKPPMTARQRDMLALKIGCGVFVGLIVLVTIVVISVANYANSSTLPATVTPDTSLTQDAQINAANATQQAQTPVSLPTPQPTAKPTQKPQPTQPATPKPTQPAPTCQAVNNNPWCYNFSPGNLITSPPGNFCSYFNCIASFVSADDPDGGYIVECQDTTYSQSGGESGSCSHHGGELRPLYSH